MSVDARILRMLTVMFLTLLVIPFASAQEIRTSAPEEVLENETFQIQYDVISETPIDVMPNIVDDKDFELIGEPQIRQISPSYFWGNDYYTLQVFCQFRPKKSGNLKLPRIELSIDGYTHKLTSKQGVLKVVKLPDMKKVECFVEVDITKKELTRGDTLTITHRLYSSEKISRIGELKIPWVEGFKYYNQTPQRMVPIEETRGGKTFYVYVIGKFVLEASRLGERIIPAGSVNVEYAYPTGRFKRDRWGRALEEQVRDVKTCEIESVSIAVKQNMIAI